MSEPKFRCSHAITVFNWKKHYLSPFYRVWRQKNEFSWAIFWPLGGLIFFNIGIILFGYENPPWCQRTHMKTFSLAIGLPDANQSYGPIWYLFEKVFPSIKLNHKKFQNWKSGLFSLDLELQKWRTRKLKEIKFAKNLWRNLSQYCIHMARFIILIYFFEFRDDFRSGIFNDGFGKIFDFLSEYGKIWKSTRSHFMQGVIL